MRRALSPIRWPHPGRPVLPVAGLTAVVFLAGLPASATATQTRPAECVVSGTFLGRWNQVELRCGSADSGRAKSAVVIPDVLRACPLLKGDRVAVTFENGDANQAASVTAVNRRGESGPSTGDWCRETHPPGQYTGPCTVEELPPPAQRADTVGATWTRRSVVTWFRDTDNGRQSVAGLCRPVTLNPGVYRIYVQEDISRGQRLPGPTYYADRRTIEKVDWDSNIYEGGIAIGGSPAPTDSVTDVAPFVRGWPGGVSAVAATPPVTPAGAFQPVALTTDPLSMTGVRFLARAIRTEPLSMTGVRFGALQIRTDPLSMTGMRFVPLRIRTAALTMTGRRFQPVSIRTQPLTMTGVRR